MGYEAETIIQNRWPQFHSLLTAPHHTEVELQYSATPSPAPVFNGIRLCSGYDRLREARMQAALIPEQGASAALYGFVTSHLPKLLLARTSLQRLDIVLIHLPLSRALFRCLGDDVAWLEDQRVQLQYGGEETALRFPFSVIPPCLLIADLLSARIRDLVQLELSTAYLNQKFKLDGEDSLQSKIERNLPFIAKDGDVASLFDTKNGGTILVAGAGPTLSRNLPLLAKLHREHKLIVVDAALEPVLAHGINPDFVVTIDAHKQMSKLLAPAGCHDLADCGLVYFPVVATDILERWQGPRYTAYSQADIYARCARQHPKSRLFSAGSVIHPAVDLAVRMGAGTVVLFGTDFSFPDDMSHALGCLLRQPVPSRHASRTVMNGEGRPVRSQTNLIGYLRDLEEYIARTPSVRFINTGKEGAMIRGAACYQHA